MVALSICVGCICEPCAIETDAQAWTQRYKHTGTWEHIETHPQTCSCIPHMDTKWHNQPFSQNCAILLVTHNVHSQPSSRIQTSWHAQSKTCLLGYTQVVTHNVHLTCGTPQHTAGAAYALFAKAAAVTCITSRISVDYLVVALSAGYFWYVSCQ